MRSVNGTIKLETGESIPSSHYEQRQPSKKQDDKMHFQNYIIDNDSGTLSRNFAETKELPGERRYIKLK